MKRRSNETRSRETQAALLDAARTLFVELGFGGCSTPMIVQRAGTTRGALYHHYPDKKAIFRAVLEREAEQVAMAISAAATNSEVRSPLMALLHGADAYLEAMRVQGRTRLLLVDGPAVLGASEMAEIDGRHARESLELGLRELLGDSRVDQRERTALADLLSSMFDQAALAVADGAAAEPFRDAMRRILSGLVSCSD